MTVGRQMEEREKDKARRQRGGQGAEKGRGGGERFCKIVMSCGSGHGV